MWNCCIIWFYSPFRNFWSNWRSNMFIMSNIFEFHEVFHIKAWKYHMNYWYENAKNATKNQLIIISKFIPSLTFFYLELCVKWLTTINLCNTLNLVLKKTNICLFNICKHIDLWTLPNKNGFADLSHLVLIVWLVVKTSIIFWSICTLNRWLKNL